jgi:1,4-alpha-glucan branching enzyme
MSTGIAERSPMLSDDDLSALVRARHADPFAVLGMHADPQGRLWVGAMLPMAVAVDVLDAAGGFVAKLERRAGSDLFEGALAGRGERFEYRLKVRWDSGAEGVYADPYAYGALIADDDLHLLAAGTHVRPYEVLGALPTTLGEGADAVAGVRFAVWAPNARRVSVVGDFNNWDGRRHLMRARGGSGVWEMFVPHMVAGDRYKYEIVGPDDALQPLKADPYARAAQLRPDSASLVAALPPRRAPPAR